MSMHYSDPKRASDKWSLPDVEVFYLSKRDVAEFKANGHEIEGESDARTPNGNPGHCYRVEFNAKLLTLVRLEYGTFNVCPDCLSDCATVGQIK